MLAPETAGPVIVQGSLLKLRHPWKLTDETITVLLRALEKEADAEIAAEIYVEGATQALILRVMRLVSEGIEEVARRGRVDPRLLDRESQDIMNGVLGVEAATEDTAEDEEIIERVRSPNKPLRPRSQAVIVRGQKPPSTKPIKPAASPNEASQSTALSKPTVPPPKNCPRCPGKMGRWEGDWYGWYSTCFQCSYVFEYTASMPFDLLEEEKGNQKQRRKQPTHGLYEKRVRL